MVKLNESPVQSEGVLVRADYFSRGQPVSPLSASTEETVYQFRFFPVLGFEAEFQVRSRSQSCPFPSLLCGFVDALFSGLP
jgi:hypothetical protein